MIQRRQKLFFFRNFQNEPGLLDSVGIRSQLDDGMQRDGDVGASVGLDALQIGVQDPAHGLVGYDDDWGLLSLELDQNGLHSLDHILVRLSPGVSIPVCLFVRQIFVGD